MAENQNKCKKARRAGYVSKGQRRNMRTGKLSFLVDTKQLDQIAPLGDRGIIRQYEQAEEKRAALLNQSRAGMLLQHVFIKGKKVRQWAPVPTAHVLAFK